MRGPRHLPPPVIITAGVALLWLLAVLSSRSSSSTHPEIPEQAEGSAGSVCAICHEDQAKESGAHPAVTQLGCESCHQTSQKDGEWNVKLAAEGNELCFLCHDNKKPRPQAGHRDHSPAVEGECVGCHDPHNSAFPSLLRGPVEDASDENLCFTCHADVAELAKQQSVHGALQMGCPVCHQTHKGGLASDQEFAFHLTKSAPSLCLDCHDENDANLATAHAGQPFAKAVCTACHNPHGSERAKLIRPQAHPPFAEKQCDVCHQEPQDGHVVLNEDGKQALCFTCHEDKKQLLETAQVKHTLLDMDDTCTGCHSPHASDQPKWLKKPVRELCGGCHEEQAVAASAEIISHKPVEMNQSCNLCHDPHASDFPNHLRADGNQLCLECHKARGAELPDKITLFNTYELTADEFRETRKLRLNGDGDRGHPLANHWVSTIPDLTRPGKKMACVTCHTAHFSEGETLARALVVQDNQGKDQKIDVCRGCHSALDKEIAAERERIVPIVAEQIRERQQQVLQLREEYLRNVPKLAGDDQDQPAPTREVGEEHLKSVPKLAGEDQDQQ